VIGNRLIAKVHPTIAGKIELRGVGIGSLKFEEQAVIRLLVDCETVLKSRVPDSSEGFIELLGVSCRRILVTSEGSNNVFAALGIGNEII
jgi:serine kinase of HPr protein (carbohydrate metabolism regulator)